MNSELRRLLVVTDMALDVLPRKIAFALNEERLKRDDGRLEREAFHCEAAAWGNPSLDVISRAAPNAGRWLCLFALSKPFGDRDKDLLTQWQQALASLKSREHDIRALFCADVAEPRELVALDWEQSLRLPHDRWWKRMNANGERAARDGAVVSIILEAIAGSEVHGWMRFAFNMGDYGAFDPEELDLRRRLFHWAMTQQRTTIVCASKARHRETVKLSQRMFYLCQGVPLAVHEVMLEAFSENWYQSMMATLERYVDARAISLGGLTRSRLATLESEQATTLPTMLSMGKFCARAGQPQLDLEGLLLVDVDANSFASLGEACTERYPFQRDVVAFVRDGAMRSDKLDIAVMADRGASAPAPAPDRNTTVPWEPRQAVQCKLLFLASNPEDTDQLALDEEMRAIEHKLRAADLRDEVTMISKLAVRTDDLLQYLNQYRPHVVHFSGHGSPHDQIVLMDHNRQARPVSGEALRKLFSALRDNIRVVILNACYSHTQAQAIAEQVECVIGMKRAIGDSAAIVFAAAFYSAIGFGRSVGHAFDQAVASLAMQTVDEADTPVLHERPGVRASDVFLVRP